MSTKLAMGEDSVDWVVDGELGATVGQEQDLRICPAVDLRQRLQRARDKGDRDEVEYLAVELAAREWLDARLDSADYASVHSGGIHFDSSTRLREFFAAMKVALKRAHDEMPWPDWATKALAAGWKPPKGWKP